MTILIRGGTVVNHDHSSRADVLVDEGTIVAVGPSLDAPTGTEVIDGVRFEFFRLQHAETENALMVGLPDHGVLITQDLIYNRVHVFIGERAFDSWAAVLQSTQALNYDTLLPGHGAPGGPELYCAMQRYLDTARDTLAKASNGPDLKALLIAAFPDHRGRVLLDHQMRFLFPKPAPTPAGTETIVG